MIKKSFQTEINPYPTISLKVDPDLKNIYDNLPDETKQKVREKMKLIIKYEHDILRLKTKYSELNGSGIF